MTLSASEISAALADRAGELAEHLIGDKPTSRTRTQLRFYPRGGLAIEIAGSRRGLWCDHGAGAGGDPLDLVKHLMKCTTPEAITWARAWLGDQPVETHRARPPARPEPVKPDTTLTARRMWTEATCATGTPVETYLRSRGLDLPDGDVIRFHPACPRGRDERLPAMLALMTNPTTAEPCGVHRTFLRHDGSGKADGTSKMMLGGAGIIRLVPDEDVTTGLGIAEGIETALAVMQRAGWSPVWACASAGGIAKFPVLAGIEALTIFPDLDDSGAGIRAAEQCSERWRGCRREVTIKLPPNSRDWLDAMTNAEANA